MSCVAQNQADAVSAAGLIPLGAIHLPVELQGLAVSLQRFFVAPHLAQTAPDAAQAGRLPALGSSRLAVQVEGVPESGMSLLAPSYDAQSMTDAVQAVGLVLEDALLLGVCYPAVELQRLPADRQCFAVAFHITQDKADVV